MKKIRPFILPTALVVEGDAVDPRKTKLIDGHSGKEVKLPLAALQMTIIAGEANRLHVELGDIAVKARFDEVFYEVSQEDLVELAAQNGYSVQPASSWAAYTEAYGPDEVKIVFRDFPDLHFLLPRATKPLALVREAGAALFEHIGLMDAVPTPSLAEEGDIIVYAIA